MFQIKIITMNIYKLNRKTGVFLLFLSSVFNSCQKAPVKVDSIYISQASIVPEVSLKLDGDVGSTVINVQSSSPLGQDMQATFVIATELLEGYNRRMSTNYIPYPEDQVTISNGGKINMVKGRVTSDDLVVTLKNWSGYDDTKKYALPIVLKSISGGMPILSESNTVFIVVEKTIQTKAAAGQFTIPKMKLASDQINEFTVEGRFNFINATNFVGQVDWSTTICTPFNLQFLVFSQNAREGDKIMAVRFPDGTFLMTTVLVDLRKWYHFAITYSAGNVTLYLNGQSIGSKTVTGLLNNQYTLGHNNRIALSEYRVWSKALTQSQIQQNVCIVDPNQSNLLAYWRFNQFDINSSNQMTDLTTNKLVTTASGAVSFTDIKCPE